MTEASARAEKPPLRSRITRWTLEGLLLVAVYLAVTTWQKRNLLSSGSTEAPAFVLMDLEGKPVSLASLRGKTVLVHFWATWCGVCRQELGTLNDIYAGLASDQALIAVVADSEDPARIRSFVKEHDIRYPVLLGNDAVLAAYHVSAFPTNYVISPNGRVSDTTVGLSTGFGLSTRMGCAKR
ncbi:MAG: TlpA family protein disulfide reductase [Myxococcales bacterium]|nr:TlpA family protein disulfide reductase [Myxococcales bacterium]